MKATVYSHKQLIGTTDLQIGDESMGCVFGEFIPNDNYFKLIQKAVWDFWTTDKPNYTKWNSLRFNVQLDNGLFYSQLEVIRLMTVKNFQTSQKELILQELT